MGKPGPSVNPDTAAATNAIRGLYYYMKDGSTAYLIAVSGSKLYYYNSGALTEIGAIADASVKPAFLTFNGKLLIADGSSAIRTWDGTTYTTIAGSPAADCLATVRNRVVANHVSEPDSVYLSSPNDETGWTTTGTAVGLRAGYGDGLKVNGFAVLGDDVFVSKVGRTTDRQKKIYRLNVAASVTSSWYLEPFSAHNAFTSKHTVANAYNNIFFADDNGFKTVKGIQEYGDLAVLPAGIKINKVFGDATCDFMAFVPGSRKQQTYPSTVAYIANLIIHRYAMLGILDENGFPLQQMGILKAPEDASNSVHPTQGKLCSECGNHTMIRKDGCDFCTACGAVGTCG